MILLYCVIMEPGLLRRFVNQLNPTVSPSLFISHRTLQSSTHLLHFGFIFPRVKRQGTTEFTIKISELDHLQLIAR